MANKLPASTGYFNKEMQAILNKGEKKTPDKKKPAASADKKKKSR